MYIMPCKLSTSANYMTLMSKNMSTLLSYYINFSITCSIFNELFNGHKLKLSIIDVDDLLYRCFKHYHCNSCIICTVAILINGLAVKDLRCAT